jgi:hypothetical protein
LQLGKLFRWHFRRVEKDFRALWRKTQEEKRLRILILNSPKNGKEKKGKLSYSFVFQACENIIPLCFECSMCLLCFSHLEKENEKNSSRNTYRKKEKMEAKNFCSSQKNVIYFLGKMKMSVRTRYTALRLSFGL